MSPGIVLLCLSPVLILWVLTFFAMLSLGAPEGYLSRLQHWWNNRHG